MTTLRVRRLDNGRPLEIAASDLRYGKPFRDHFVVRYTLTWRQEPLEGDVPYVRHSPNSKWAVRVKVLPQIVPAAPEQPEGRLARVVRFVQRASRRRTSPDLGGGAA
jgi:hypothetical protein